MIGDRKLDNWEAQNTRERETDPWMRLAPDACWVTDESGTIEAANEAAAALLGVRQQALAGQPISRFLDRNAGGDEGLRAWLGALGEGELLAESMTLRDTHRDPVAAHVRVLRVSRNGRAVLHWLVVSSATPDGERGRAGAELQRAYENLQHTEEELRTQNEELRTIEEELRVQNEELDRQQQRYQALFDFAPGGYLVTDQRSTIYEANQAVADLLGVPAQELPGTQLDSYVLAADGAIYGKHLDTVRRGDGARTVQWEMRVQQPGGRVIPTAVTATQVTAPSQRDTEAREGVRWLLRDVRHEKQMQAALVQAEKMALTGQLAASLAHEINNPLTAALGSIELVREALADGKDPAALLDVMHASLARAARVVSQLRDVRRHAGPEEKQQADLNTLVENVLLLAGTTASAAGVEISWQGADDVPALPLMVDGMQQVFLNLVLNAIEAMQGKGELTVRIRRAERPAWIGPAVGIEFADTGPGIAPEIRDCLFDPFETTKEGGSGLGLFISKNIVEQHGGEIEVESAEGEGATFTVWLPV